MNIPNVSIIEEGPALGHGFSIDQKSLASVVSGAPPRGVPVRLDHSDSLQNVVGTAKNFRVSGPRVLADLTLLTGSTLFSHAKELLTSIPSMFGFSILGSGSLEKIGDTQFFRVAKLYAADLVAFPAANTGGIYGQLAALSLSVPAGMIRLATARQSSDLDSKIAAALALPVGQRAKALTIIRNEQIAAEVTAECARRTAAGQAFLKSRLKSRR